MYFLTYTFWSHVCVNIKRRSQVFCYRSDQSYRSLSLIILVPGSGFYYINNMSNLVLDNKAARNVTSPNIEVTSYTLIIRSNSAQSLLYVLSETTFIHLTGEYRNIASFFQVPCMCGKCGTH